MKITKSQLKEIIKEEVTKLQKKNILENRKKEIVRELRTLNEYEDPAMDVSDSKRLSKVAKELNIGIGTIVDFLQKKGISIESNPNAKISSDNYDLLEKEFVDQQELMMKKYGDMLSMIQKVFEHLKKRQFGQFNTESDFLSALVHHTDSKNDIEREIDKAAREIVEAFDIDSSLAKEMAKGYTANSQPESVLNKINMNIASEKRKKEHGDYDFEYWANQPGIEYDDLFRDNIL